MKISGVFGIFMSGFLVIAAVGILHSAVFNSPIQETTITGIAIPDGYRDWKVLAASHRLDKDEIRLILANDIAWNAAEKNVLPFPEGSVIAKLAYKALKSGEWAEAVIPGAPQRVEIIVKDSKKYTATGGWGFGRFVQGKPVGDKTLYATCFPCHQANVKNHDFVFTRLAR